MARALGVSPDGIRKFPQSISPPPPPPARPSRAKALAWAVIKDGRYFPVYDETLIGRDKSKVDIFLDDRTVSRLHAKIILDGVIFSIVDFTVSDSHMVRRTVAD